MIPLDLLRVEKRGRRIKPRYLYDAAPAAAVLEAAAKAKTLGDFKKAVSSLGWDRKLVEGLAHVAQRHLEIEEVDYRRVTKARLEVFKISTALGYALSEERREEVFKAAAERLGVALEEVKNLFSKAFVENRLVKTPPRLAPHQLVEKYNLSLIQTLFFKSINIKARIPNSPQVVKRLIRAVKGLGLMYTIEEAPGCLEIQIDGPVTALRNTERYGTRLAKLIPYITAAERWEISAEVKIGDGVYYFREVSTEAPPLPKEVEEEEAFDSSIEQEFYRQISRLCRVEREPEVVVVDKRVYIPDFKIGDLLIEIVGFWTPDYVKRKYEKLRRVGKPLLVLLSEELAMATWRDLPPNTVVFKDRPRVSDVYKYIKPHCVSSNHPEATRSQ
ncbi:MAG: DUF790 family protein [Pyrobaculum sp.]